MDSSSILWVLHLLGIVTARKPRCPSQALLQKKSCVHPNIGLSFYGYFASCLFYFPIYLQTLGFSTMETGLRLVPLAVVFALSPIAVGQFLHRYYLVNIALQRITAISCGLLCLLNAKIPLWQVFVCFGTLGIGIGGSYVTNLMRVLTSVPEENQASVQAASWRVRAMGIAIGLSIASVILCRSPTRIRLLRYMTLAWLNESRTKSVLVQPSLHLYKSL